MTAARWLRKLAPICLCLVLLISACGSSTPNKYDDVQKETSGSKAPSAVVKTAEQGATFNKFFPKSQDGYQVIPSQEKKGFAEYKLNKGNETVAMLTINDTTSVPAAAAKYANATDNIAGYPAVKQGSTATGVLINDRYQVKVLSRSPNFTEADRAAWIQKFNLKGIAQLKGALPTTTPTAVRPVPNPKSGNAPSAKSPILVPQPAS